MQSIRVYADTSVFGGVYDDELKEPSLTFFAQVGSRQFILVTSAVVQDEIVAAPLAVRRFFDEMPGFAEVTDISTSALDLRDAYLQAKIVAKKHSDDARSCGLGHGRRLYAHREPGLPAIVHFQKIPCIAP
jgi:hypothetical protein